MIGETIAHYHITAKLGEGGMGEVYRATDTKLHREVAIKVLPPSFAQDAERMARFTREAQVLASLNHPNIAQIYGVEEHALVMELVEGETLANSLPIQTALEYARQIAEALEYAHERGVIHRDLKPTNIKVTPEGTVKLLDFGLAKAIEDPIGRTEDPAHSPTLTLGATRLGLILGTAAYMSPEQANGKPADRRADIWSFGAVLYEMLTGKRAFAGESVSDTLASVLKLDPDWNALPGTVPASIRMLVRRCLKKDRKQRLQAIGDARIAIEESLSGATLEPDTVPVAVPQRHNLIPYAVAATLAVISIGLGVVAWRATRPVDRPLMRLSVDLGPDAVAGETTAAAISPDGARLVFPAKSSDGKQMLAARLLAETKPTLLSGTENGRDPFFSPDGKWIGFFASGKMKKISVLGGAPIVLCDAPYGRAASWGEDGGIVVALSGVAPISRVPAEGGTPQPVTKLQGAATHRWPQVLPGTEAVLFTLSPSTNDFEDASIAAVSSKTGEIKILVRGGYFGRYLPTGNSTGHLVYVHQGVLFGVPFEPARLELRGTAVPLLEDLAADPTSGAGQFSFSGASSGPGTFVYRTGNVSDQSWPVLWLDSSGKTKPLIATPGHYLEPRFSPDGQRLALAQITAGKYSIFVYDLQRDTMTRLAFGTDLAAYPACSPDGKHVVFRFQSAGGFSIGWTRADAAGEIQHLLDSKNLVVPYSFFLDGRRLVYLELAPESGLDIWTLALDVSDPDHPKPGKQEPFLRTPFNETTAVVSPDGRWIAYGSDESGRFEVWVRPFPGPGGKWQISNAGGRLPVWSRNGRELFFQNMDRRVMVEDYTATGDSFMPGKPRLWSDQQLHEVGLNLNYDLAPDGKRFAILPELKAPTEEKRDVHVTFLLNFFDELRPRAPVGTQ